MVSVWRKTLDKLLYFKSSEWNKQLEVGNVILYSVTQFNTTKEYLVRNSLKLLLKSKTDMTLNLEINIDSFEPVP